ncbi:MULTISPECIES: class I SAM-dependent methyltransferase [unclassified Minwuia]|uniref:class I SAM-dependent methyltransferase n=1 Tax=unclassified Minwuia TaxID=2618799 RepID=UPI002478EC1F|nr:MULTISPECIES: class I SAM-dependent methyltransferase [unclassified Minwuia]
MNQQDGTIASSASLYDRHPINADQILLTLKEQGRNLDQLRPVDLRPHDQDHYGGEAAVFDLAAAAGLQDGDRVIDICAGVGGPSRLLAEKFTHARFLAFDLHGGRCHGAQRLNAVVGMDRQIDAIQGDAQAMPFADNSLDIALSQEAFLHIPDKQAVLNEAARILKPGGRLGFTDLIAGPALDETDRAALEAGIEMRTLQTVPDYKAKFRAAGLSLVSHDDLSPQWVTILTERLEWYRAMNRGTRQTLGDGVHERYMDDYETFVGLVQAGRLGGGRFVLRKG